MKKVRTINEHQVVNKIYVIRGLKVMVDEDLAEMYGVETRRLNEQVKRNLERFPKDFMFQLNAKDLKKLELQNPTGKWGGRRTKPFVFTEYGVLMLSSVLNNPIAIAVNIQIMRVYAKIREMLSAHKDILLKLDQIESKLKTHDDELMHVFSVLKSLLDPEKSNRTKIGFKLKS